MASRSLLIAEYDRRSAIHKHWNSAYRAWQLALQSEARDTKQTLSGTITALECLEASMSLWMVTVLDADTGAQKQLFLGDHPRPRNDCVFDHVAAAMGHPCQIAVLEGLFILSIEMK
jgi:hypothetical protein